MHFGINLLGSDFS